MINPKLIKAIVPGARYALPTYKVDNEGVKDGDHIDFIIDFCKGNKQDPESLRQEGVFTESIIQCAKEFLEEVNKGELASRETSIAITKLDEALMWLGKRAEDRKLRGVQGSYQK